MFRFHNILFHAFLFHVLLFHTLEYTARQPLIPNFEGNKNARRPVLPVGGHFEENNYSRSSEGRYRPPRLSAMYGMGGHGRGVDYRRRHGELKSLWRPARL